MGVSISSGNISFSLSARIFSNLEQFSKISFCMNSHFIRNKKNTALIQKQLSVKLNSRCPYNTQNLAKFIHCLNLPHSKPSFCLVHDLLPCSILHSSSLEAPSVGSKIWLMTKKLLAVAHRKLNLKFTTLTVLFLHPRQYFHRI